MRIGLFVDVMNMYHCLKDERLDYKLLYDYAKSYGNIQKAIVYGCQKDGEADGFLKQLRSIGYEINYTNPKMVNGSVLKANRDIDICIGILDSLDHLDTIILCSSDGDFVPIIERVKNKGIQAIIIGSNISNGLINVCDKYIDLTENKELLFNEL